MKYIVDMTDYSGYKSQVMTDTELYKFYQDTINKSEYNDFYIWLYDMVKSELIKKL